MPGVELDGVSLRRDATQVLGDVSFTVDPGSLTVLVGASGAGKTSVLRVVAGLEPSSTGVVRIGDRDVTRVSAGDRDLAMAFQDPVVFPTRDVGRNIGFPLEIRRAAADEIADRVGAEARILHIERLLRRDAERLSVGEAHVVQLARLLVRCPSVLLLDEPFAALEAELAGHVRREMALLQREFGVTTLLATNDPHDVMFAADRIVVLEGGRREGGRVVQVGTPTEVYERPETAASAMLTGDAQLFTVEVEATGDGVSLVHPAFRIRAPQRTLRRYRSRRLQLVTRPEWWVVDPSGSTGGVVRKVTTWAGMTTVELDVNGQRLVVRSDVRELARFGLERDARVGLRARRWVVLDPRDGRRIELDD